MPSSIVAITASAILGLTLTSPEARGQAQGETPAPVIRAETRLVAVEVVVRDKDGPVTGLTRADFKLLDQRKQQTIAVFSAGGLGGASPGGVAVSSRADRPAQPDHSDHPIAGATVVPLDLLNTSLDNQAMRAIKYCSTWNRPTAANRSPFTCWEKSSAWCRILAANTLPRPKRCASGTPRIFPS
jgi:hypothetical protein